MAVPWQFAKKGPANNYSLSLIVMRELKKMFQEIIGKKKEMKKPRKIASLVVLREFHRLSFLFLFRYT